MASLLTPQQQALIGRLYDCALDDTLWRALCIDMADLFGGASDAIVILENAAGAHLFSSTRNFDEDAVADYEAYYWQHDIWAHWAHRLGLGQVHSSADHIREIELERTEFYADFCRPRDLFHVIGAIVPIAPGEVALLGVHRQRCQGPFSQSALVQAQLQEILPHLQRALQIRTRLAQSDMAERCARAALDVLGTAVLLIDARLEVLYANAMALDLFGADPPRGLQCLATTGARWRMPPPLVRAVQQAIGAGKRGNQPMAQSLRLPRAGRPDLYLSVAPFHAQQGPCADRPCAMILAREPRGSGISSETLQQLFELTPAEAQVGQALAQGGAIDSIATANGVSVNTIKTHLHRIYGKTGAARQGELVALIHQCAGGLAAPAPPR